MAHDNSGTRDELQLSNNTNDRSYSSSDSCEAIRRKTQNSLLKNENVNDSKICSEKYEPNNTSFFNQRDIGNDLRSSQMST